MNTFQVVLGVALIISAALPLYEAISYWVAYNAIGWYPVELWEWDGGMVSIAVLLCVGGVLLVRRGLSKWM